MQKTIRAIYPDGRQEVHEITPDTDRYALLKKLIGGWLEYVPAHYHTLNEHEVVIDEEGLNKNLLPNWVGSRLIGLDLTKYPPFRGPLVIVPHDPEEGPSPAQQRVNSASPDNMVNLFARALEGDQEALNKLGVSSPDEIMVIDSRPEVTEVLYLIHPDGRAERRSVGDAQEGREWIESRLGRDAYRVPDERLGLTAYAVIYSARPADKRPNLPAQKALGLRAALHGPVVLAPTGEHDPSLLHQRLDEALSGDVQARADLGITANW